MGHDMIQKNDVFNINFYKKEKFNGSYKGMRYRIEKQETEEEKHLLTTVWPGPYNYDHTEEKLKESRQFPFDNDGLAQAVDWLNEIWDEKWKEII